MPINSISGSNSQVYAVGQLNENGAKFNKTEQKNTESKQRIKADTLVLSEEVQKYGQIKQKIKNGFYDKPEVLKEVAIKLNDDILATEK